MSDPTITSLVTGSYTIVSPGEALQFEPKDDITPLEAVRCSEMFALATSRSGAYFDFKAFSEKHKLERHFQ